MAKKTIYESKRLPGVTFNSYDEALRAEQDLDRRENESSAMEAIGKFNRSEPMAAMAEKAGPDAWETAPKEDLQKISEGQVLNEMYGSPMGLARGYGLTSNTSEPAQKFVSNLKDESKANEENLRFKAQMEKDTHETKSNEETTSVYDKKIAELRRIRKMPEGPEKEAAYSDFVMSSAPGTYYGLSNEGINRAGKRAYITEWSKIPAKEEGTRRTTVAKIEEESNTPQGKFEDATELRKEFNNQSKTFNDVRDSYNKIVASGKNSSAAGDLALLFNYMKILDPGSVVRESEFANAASTGAFGDRMQALVQKIIKGERLNENMRKDFLDRAKMLYDEQVQVQQGRINKYTNIAQKRGLSVEDVITQVPNETKTIPSGPRAGTWEKREDGWHKIK